jgi:papain like cysteine protease AvrRpt2
MPTLPYAAVKQGEHANWCWAAVTAGVWSFYERPHTIPMCEVVSAVRAESCCDPVPEHCERRAALDRALRRFRLLGSMRAGVVPLHANGNHASIEAEIASGRPVGVGITFGIIDHFCVIFGFDPQSETVQVADPFFDDAPGIRYAELRNNYHDGGRWVATYLTKPPPQA